MKKSVKILLSILCVIFVCIFAFSGYKLYSIIHEYKVAEKTYSGLSDKVVSTGNRKGNKKPDEIEDNRDPEVSPILFFQRSGRLIRYGPRWLLQ